MRESMNLQKGQSLILFMAFAAAMVGMMLVAFNSGQVGNAKMRAMNTADAAAYSGALWQARTLNFQAYMNRALVVNEVTIAQSVSLRSWVGYLDRFVSNVALVTRWIPIWNAAITAIERGLDGVDRVIQRILPPAELALRFINEAEHGLQDLMNVQGTVIALDLASNVARQNGAALSPGNAALFLLNEKRWLDFTQAYERSSGKGPDPRSRLKEVALDSRDGFTNARDRTIGRAPVFQLRKQGGTDLIDYDAWKGLDSAELRTAWFFGWRIRAPVGWGGAQAYSTKGAVARIGHHGNINEWGDADGRLANAASMTATNARSVQRPFPGYRDLTPALLRGAAANVRLPFAVEVLIDRANVPTANSAFGAKATLLNGTALEHDPQYFGNKGGVYATAQACVKFERPSGAARRDGATELPSLFNPYWRASMATDSKTARVVSDGAKGLPPVEAAFMGAGTCT